MTGTKGPRVAVFRPDDVRLERASELLTAHGMTPVLDPMLEIVPTDHVPRTDADIVILTSMTGAKLVGNRDWDPAGMTLCAIGPTTAEEMHTQGYTVDILPEEYTSHGIVEALADRVDGCRVEVARSDHGSPVLITGLIEEGAYVHETILYELTRPAEAGTSISAAIEGRLDAVLFTSSLTIEHVFTIAESRGEVTALRDALERMVVGVIGPPTADTAKEWGISVDVVAPEATFDSLASVVGDRLAETSG